MTLDADGARGGRSTVVTSIHTIVVHKSSHAYSSHPCITMLASGGWLVVFGQSIERRPYLHPPSDPRFLNVAVRSDDQGQTWGDPRAVPNYDWYGVEASGIAQLSNGDVLLNQWRFRWYPLELARKLWSGGGEIFLTADHPYEWRRAEIDDDWERHPFPYARADDGAFVHISTDEGRTWDETVRVEIEPYRGAFSPKGAIELDSGDVVLALGSHDYDPYAASFIVRSEDGGRSWSAPVEVARSPGLIFSEPTAVATANGRLLVLSREETSGFVYQSESDDEGRTWSRVRRLPLWGYPTHAIRLADGRILAIYGRRREPFGIRAALSEDNGRSWGPEIVVTNDCPNDNLGYPSVIEYSPGQLFAVHYSEDEEGVTCIRGTYFSV
jgi:photosystem II stability/assembly factor-like uncharacterized protein